MTHVLVVDDDDVLREDLVSALRASGYDVAEARSVDTAIARLRLQAPDVLLTDLRMEGRDGIDLLTELRAISPGTLPVLMSGFATARDYQTATNLGAVKVLTKPFTPAELLAAVQHAIDCGTGFRGSVHGLSLVDLLQMFHFGRRTITLHVDGSHCGVIELTCGEITHAQLGDLTGVEALERILAAPTGAMRTSVPRGATRRTIDVPFQSLIMDVLREIDENGKGTSSDLAQSDLDAAFETWSSLPPASVDAVPHAKLQELASLLERTAPSFGAAVVLPERERPIVLRSFGDDAAWPGVVHALRQQAETLCGGDACVQLEHVGERVAFAIVFAPQGEYALLVDAPMLDRFSPQRFRSQIRQVASFLLAS